MVDPSQWPSFLTKIGVVVGACLLAYAVLRIVIEMLTSLFGWATTEPQKPGDDPADAEEPDSDPIEDVPGLHVLSYGAEHTLVDKYPSERSIRATIRNLDWVDGFHQVLLVTSSGVSLEVGGNLDPDIGLASVYRDWKKEIYRVTREPPTTVQNMEDLLVSFYLGDGRWERMYDYEETPVT